MGSPRARRRRPIAACAVAVVALAGALGGCGDEEAEVAASTTSAAGETAPREDAPAPPDGEPGGAEPAERPERPLGVEEVLAAVLTESGSAEQACGELVTEAFVREAYGGRRNCVTAREHGGVAREIEIAGVEEKGETASATVVPAGGPYGGVDVEVGLVADPKPEGAWLVDSLFADVPAGP